MCLQLFTFLHLVSKLREHVASAGLLCIQLAVPAAAFASNSQHVQLSLESPPSSSETTVCDRGTLITGLGNKARRDGHVGPGGQASAGRKGCLGKSHHAL